MSRLDNAEDSFIGIDIASQIPHAQTLCWQHMLIHTIQIRDQWKYAKYMAIMYANSYLTNLVLEADIYDRDKDLHLTIYYGM